MFTTTKNDVNIEVSCRFTDLDLIFAVLGGRLRLVETLEAAVHALV